MIHTNVRTLRVPTGDAHARFATFYRAERPAAVRLAALLTQRVAAEDVVQEAFAGLYPRFADLDNPAAYLRVAILNGCRQMHRRRAVELDRLPRLTTPGVFDPELPAMADAVAALPYRQRAVLVLRYWLDLSEDEIAEALGCRPGTVKSLSSRALERLGEEVER
ncbi:MAG: sigma-70 family RNA polymerase sigma factor [Actinomycetota bacterium]|nr:sigma-70 family RNA polymerase sigma factor [Actinomycetota bacterium]